MSRSELVCLRVSLSSNQSTELAPKKKGKKSPCTFDQPNKKQFGHRRPTSPQPYRKSAILGWGNSGSRVEQGARVRSAPGIRSTSGLFPGPPTTYRCPTVTGAGSPCGDGTSGKVLALYILICGKWHLLSGVRWEVLVYYSGSTGEVACLSGISRFFLVFAQTSDGDLSKLFVGWSEAQKLP